MTNINPAVSGAKANSIFVAGNGPLTKNGIHNRVATNDQSFSFHASLTRLIFM
jgi:hypothetical protein